MLVRFLVLAGIPSFHDGDLFVSRTLIPDHPSVTRVESTLAHSSGLTEAFKIRRHKDELTQLPTFLLPCSG